MAKANFCVVNPLCLLIHICMFYLSERTEHSNIMQSSTTCLGHLFQPSSGGIKMTYTEQHFLLAEKCYSTGMHSVSSVVFVLMIKTGIDF